MIKVDWLAGPPPGNGEWWVVWINIDGDVSVQPVEVGPAMFVPDGKPLIKTLGGPAYDFEQAKKHVIRHAPFVRPVFVEKKAGKNQ